MSENQELQNHNMILQNRRLLELDGVTDVDCFDESLVRLYTVLGELEIRGSKLHVNAMDVTTGKLSLEGEIQAIIYGDKGMRKKPGVLMKLFR